VLDTQVWLDWLHFRDPRCTELSRRVEAGGLDIVYDAGGEAEWHRVLTYPAFGLDPLEQADLRARFAALGSRHDGHDAPRIATPRCRDPDDQKFIELAVRADARLLLTRDGALLALRRRLARSFGLTVLPPVDLEPPGSAAE
jgi:predicted nucleic acid-binding protein